MAARTALFFDVFARNRTGNTFGQIIKSTDTLRGKIAAVGKLAAGAAVAGLAAFATHGVKAFLDFDSAMSKSLSIMGDVSGPMRQRMEDAARAVAQTTKFGANEAAEAYFFLASAGLDAEQAVSAMPQVAEFATAGMFDLARATDLATDAQSALGLSVQDPEQNLRNLTRVTDVLVGANSLANASVEQFATSLTGKAGPAMRQVGVEIETGVAVLALYADQGLKAERASSVLAATIEQLTRNAINNTEEFDRLGIAVFDSEGNMRNLVDIASDLDGALGGMSDEQQKATLMQLGFNRTALEGVQRMIGMSDQIREYEADLQSMAGITEEVADKQREAFDFQLAMIKSFVTNAAMQLGEVLVRAIFTVGAHIGEMGRMFGELPEFVQTGVLAIGGLALAAPVAVGAFRKVKGAIDAARLALAAMSTAGRVATLSMGAIGLALAAGATILAFFANRNLEAQQRVDELRGSLDRQTGAITENTREQVANRLESEGMLAHARELGISLDTLAAAYLGESDALAEVRAALIAAEEAGTEYRSGVNGTIPVLDDNARAARALGEDLGVQVDALAEAQAGHERTSEFVGENADAQDELAGAVEVATGAVQDEVDAIGDLISSLNEMVSTVFAARDAERGFQQALDDATESVKENGKNLDITTEKGRKNQAQLDKLAESALKDAAATLEDAEAKGDLAAGHDQATKKMETARAEFIKIARQMGKSKKEAGALADELGLIPGNYEARITADASGARRQVGSFVSWVNRQTASVHVVGRGFAGHFAEGGFARRGSVAMVGEEGPELVAFGQDAQVFPADETRRLLSRGIGTGADSGGRRGINLERYIELLRRGLIRLGDVTDDEWNQLLALGWQGRAGDGMEALYPPLEGVGREFIKVGEVTKTEWQRLKRLGWQGKAGDRMEALYPPLDSLAVEAGKAARLLRDANLNRISPTGNRRTFDFFRSGGRSFAHIFGTGETLALGQMGEMQAGRFLKSIGKLAQGGFARRGTVAMVGEEGPELVQFGRDAHVTPAGETRRILAGGGGETRMIVEFDFRNASDSQFATWFEGMVRKGRVRVSK